MKEVPVKAVNVPRERKGTGKLVFVLLASLLFPATVARAVVFGAGPPPPGAPGAGNRMVLHPPPNANDLHITFWFKDAYVYGGEATSDQGNVAAGPINAPGSQPDPRARSWVPVDVDNGPNNFADPLVLVADFWLDQRNRKRWVGNWTQGGVPIPGSAVPAGGWNWEPPRPSGLGDGKYIHGGTIYNDMDKEVTIEDLAFFASMDCVASEDLGTLDYGPVVIESVVLQAHEELTFQLVTDGPMIGGYIYFEYTAIDDIVGEQGRHPITKQCESPDQGDGILFIADAEGSVEGNVSFDADYPYPHMQTRAGDAVLGVGYGVVNWGEGFCTAGKQARLANWNNPNDDYEKLGTWGSTGWWREITRAGRGLVRYDQDTYVVLSTQYLPENANASCPPTLLQIEYYDDWFDPLDPNQVFIGYTADQYLDSLNFDSMYLVRAAPRPGPSVQWGPRPQASFLTPPGPCDWTWTGSGTVGKLQFPDTYTVGPSYAWNNDPNANPIYDYITFCSRGQNYLTVDNAWGPFNVGDLYKDSRAVSGNATDYFGDSSCVELSAFYGEEENVLYLAQYAGRIYKVVGGKNLGWRRRAGQAGPGTRLGDGTYITQSPDWFFPVYVGGSTYATDTAGGGPVIGNAYQVDPNDPNSPWVGTAMTSVELFNADPNFPLDPKVSNRHYTGLAVDCGGRVYAVSERIVDSTCNEPTVKYQGTLADVWNGAPDDYGPNRIETQTFGGDPNILDPNDPNWGHYELFGDPRTTNVVVGDVLQLMGGSVQPAFLNVPFTIQALDPNGRYAKLNGDCGDSVGNFDVSFTVYPPGGSPIPDPVTNPFTSQALIDVYLPDGTLDTTIDLNTLTRPDGLSLGAYRYDGGRIQGVIIHGDVEIDPGLVYVSDPNAPGYDPNWPMDPLGDEVTRLWIYCVGGDGLLGSDDGLDLVVVDVFIDPNDPNGGVAGASFVGGTDDGDIDLGMFQGYSPLSSGFLPWGKWIAFSELEFDGASNLVAVGGRGMNDNRYAGMTAANIREAVARMVGEAAGDPNDPNNDGIVGINGFNMDMNIYGFKTAYGMSFANSPLSNYGSCLPEDKAVLIDTEPDPNGSLPKTQNNLLLCVFDKPIALPAAGNPLVIKDLSDPNVPCKDVSHFFTYSIDADDPNGCTLEGRETDPNDPNNHDVLPDMTWYQVNSAPGWTMVEPFQFEVYTLVGDCTPSARVTTADYSCVKAALGQRDDVRPDLNGSGRVTTADYSVVKANLGHRAPAKPVLCP